MTTTSRLLGEVAVKSEFLWILPSAVRKSSLHVQEATTTLLLLLNSNEIIIIIIVLIVADAAFLL